MKTKYLLRRLLGLFVALLLCHPLLFSHIDCLATTKATMQLSMSTIEVQLPFDYIELHGDEINPNGDVWVCRVMSNQGVNRSTIESYIDNALSDADISSIISSIELGEWSQNVEGEITITFTANTTGEERELTLICGSSSYPLTQGCMTSPIYTLTVNKSTIAKGERITLTLSGSVDYAKYTLYKDGIQYGYPKIGSGSAITFTAYGEGVYTCRSTEPAEVEMSGTRTVSLYTFYSRTHTSSSVTTYSLSPNGETLTLPFTPSPNNATYRSQLSSILTAYNAGNSAVWNTHMKLTYNASNNTLVVTTAPNLSDTTITNNTYFKIGSSGNTLTFTQSGGGMLLSFPYHYSFDNQAERGSIVLEGSQYLVSYHLTNGGRVVGDGVLGTGGAISIPLPALVQGSSSSPSIRGKYNIIATYQGDTISIGGIYVTSTVKILSNSNFIATEHYLTSKADSSYLDVTYYDGMGYPTQVINVLGTPQKNHLVTPIYYDALRRDDAKGYLPYADTTGSQSGTHISSVITPIATPFANQRAFYTSLYGAGDAQYAYLEKVYGSSIAGRVKEQLIQGEAYRIGGRGGANTEEITQKNEYLSNCTGEVLDIRIVAPSGGAILSSNHTLTISGYLPEHTLYKSRVVSPDSTAVEQFTLSDGRVLLTQIYSLASGSTDTLRTYYLYDKYLHQRYVITPNGSKRILATLRTNGLEQLTIGNSETDNLNLDEFKGQYCYYYGYDGRGQIVEKQLPGNSAMTILYDNAGRAVASQDSLLKLKSQWKFSTYDRAGRTLAHYLVYAPEPSSLKSWVADSTNAGALYNYNGQNRNILLSLFSYDSEPTSTSLGAVVYNATGLQRLTGVVTVADTCSRTRSLLTFDKVLDLASLEAYEASVSSGTPNSSLLRYRLSRYYYDSLARVVQKVTLYPNGERTVASIKYGFTGNILTSAQELTSTGIDSNGESNNVSFFPATIIERTEYDHRLRPVKTVAEAYTNTAANVINSSLTGVRDSLIYSYDELGRLLQTTLSTISPTTITSTFNIQNWLTTFRALNGNKTLYSQSLRYYNPVKGAKPLFGGNISEWEVGHATINTQGAYTGLYSLQNYLFSYDGLGRLQESKRLVANSLNDSKQYTEKNITYDSNGNILTLSRFGESATAPKDNFTFAYSGDKISTLSGVTDYHTITSTNGGNGTNSYVQFDYDVNGNTTFDGLRNTSLTYNQLNTLTSIGNMSGTRYATYSFFADGAKYEVRDSLGGGRRYLGTFSQSITPTGNNSSSYTLTTDEINTSSPLLVFYLVSNELEMAIDDGNNAVSITRENISSKKQVRIVNIESSFLPLWRVSDHLGSVRVVLDDNANILEQNDYYPFGLRTDSGRAYATTTYNRQKYNGKEQQSSLIGINLIDYGARFYDPILTRWTTQDPLAEKYASTSPYVYCMGNPVRLVDPNGMKIVGVTGQDANNIVQDLREILRNDVFKQFRKLIKSNLFNNSIKNISEEDKNKAFAGVELNDDQKALVNFIMEAINSGFTIEVEYKERKQNISHKAELYLEKYLRNINFGISLEEIKERNQGGYPAGLFMLYSKGGVTTGLSQEDNKSSLSLIILDGYHYTNRAITTGHEILGHGLSLLHGITSFEGQHVNAVQIENLILRVYDAPNYQRKGDYHSSELGNIAKPYDIPSFK